MLDSAKPGGTMRTAVTLLLTFFSIAGTATAWEPPSEDVATAIGHASFVVLGRVTSLKEIEVEAIRTVSEARVRVLDCFLGDGCTVGEDITVRFLSRSYSEEVDPGFGLPTTFDLSAEILFVFSATHASEGSRSFNVDVHDRGIDSAFWVSDAPGEDASWVEGEARLVGNVYWPQRRQRITRAELVSWTQARRDELTVGRRRSGTEILGAGLRSGDDDALTSGK